MHTTMSVKHLWMNGLGYSRFEDSISDHNVSLATACFCKTFSNRSSLKLSFKHLRADAQLKFIQ